MKHISLIKSSEILSQILDVMLSHSYKGNACTGSDDIHGATITSI